MSLDCKAFGPVDKSHEVLALLVQNHEFAYLPRVHLGVDAVVAEAGVLPFAGAHDPLPDGGAALPRGHADQLVRLQARDLQVDVDAVAQGAADAPGVALALGLADALLLRQPFEPARAGGHRGDEDALGGEGEGIRDAGDGDDAVFQRLTQGLQNGPAAFRKFARR